MGGCHVALACLLAACVQSHLVPCGDKQCPSNTTCVAGDLCATDDQIAACSNKADGDTCSVGTTVGRCDRGVCVGGGCGNRVVDVGEVCDDGNTDGADGCSADCMKVEVCGDAIVDDGEDCDDGNMNPSDGCDTCSATTWQATAVIGGNANKTAVGLSRPSHIASDRRGNLYISETNRVRRIDANGVVTTLAGNGTAGFSGDGGPATSALLNGPTDVAVDGLGNVYIADSGNNRIRLVDENGIIHTFAGNGSCCYPLGDGALATDAHLQGPNGVAVDGLGNVYIADSRNNVIRLVDTAGIITTIAGTGEYGWAGDGGPANTAHLAWPLGLAIDENGNLFIAEYGSSRVRRIDGVTNVITTVAGGGATYGDGGLATDAQLQAPTDITVDATAANLYIADQEHQRVRWVDVNNVIDTIAGDGTVGFGGDGSLAVTASFNYPSGVALGSGVVYVGDVFNHRVRQIDLVTGIITTYAGTGTETGDGGAATSAPVVTPSRMAFHNGELYFADPDTNRVRKVDSLGVITTVAGSGTEGFGGDTFAATSALLHTPSGVAVGGDGTLYIADTRNYRVRKVDTNGTITTIAGDGIAATVPSQGDGGPATQARLRLPTAVAVDTDGNLYIADSNQIRCVSSATKIMSTYAGTGISGYSGDDGAATSAQLNSPTSVKVDGNDLLIADAWNGRIRRVNGVTRMITTVAGGGSTVGDDELAKDVALAFPSDMAPDGQGGFYILERNAHSVRYVGSNLRISTVAGDRSYDPFTSRGGTGDGGPARDARFGWPESVVVGGGNIYIGALWDHRVRKIDGSGIITTLAGRVDPESMGPFAQARLADPRAFVVGAPFTLIAGGASGTLQAARGATQWLEVVGGRYPQPDATANLARFRGLTFGSVGGVAYDAAAGLIYITLPDQNALAIVTIVDIDDENTWTIATLGNGAPGSLDGPLATAQFRGPTGLYLDAASRQLYVADTGNHVIRQIDLAAGIATATVQTIIGTRATRGFYGDGGVANMAALYAPRAITRCPNGDLFVADTGNQRIRRVATTSIISTVLGDGNAASSGEGHPANAFSVNTPLGLGCDGFGNLFVTSTTAVRLLPADKNGVVDGTGDVQTIYGRVRDTFPAAVTTCLTGLAVVDTASVQVADSCTGLLVELRRER